MSDWKSVLGSIAPTLATALGGPMAGTAVKFLAGHFLGDDDADAADIEAAIVCSTPEQLTELKRIDADFKVEMKKLGIDVYKIEVDDRKDARKLAAVNMMPQIILSVIFIGGYFGLVYMLFAGHVVIDESIRDMSNILLGVLTANIPGIMQFWFGSSHGSKHKNLTTS